MKRVLRVLSSNSWMGGAHTIENEPVGRDVAKKEPEEQRGSFGKLASLQLGKNLDSSLR
jgi:hypothetical protein